MRDRAVLTNDRHTPAQSLAIRSATIKGLAQSNQCGNRSNRLRTNEINRTMINVIKYVDAISSEQTEAGYSPMNVSQHYIVKLLA